MSDKLDLPYLAEAIMPGNPQPCRVAGCSNVTERGVATATAFYHLCDEHVAIGGGEDAE